MSLQGNRRAPKWKAIAAELLQANGGVLKLKKLQSKALKQAQLSGDNAKSELKSEMLAKVRCQMSGNVLCLNESSACSLSHRCSLFGG